MKIACTSTSFASAFARGELTQLEWLDACANELEVDGVVLGRADFPRSDDEYLAQIKKTAVDLGLTIAALDDDDVFATGGDAIEIARALGAPLVVGRAPPRRDDPSAWNAFAATVGSAARAAKRANVTLALRNAAGTICENAADARRIAKDVDSSWLRHALDATSLDDADDAHALLAKSTIAFHAIDGLRTFANATDFGARRLVERVARFRGFVALEATDAGSDRRGYHDAVARFAALRASALAGIGTS